MRRCPKQEPPAFPDGGTQVLDPVPVTVGQSEPRSGRDCKNFHPGLSLSQKNPTKGWAKLLLEVKSFATDSKKPSVFQSCVWCGASKVLALGGCECRD